MPMVLVGWHPLWQERHGNIREGKHVAGAGNGHIYMTLY